MHLQNLFVFEWRYFGLMMLIFLFPIFVIAQENENISSVTVQGLTNISEASILSKLETQTGMPFSSKTIKEDVQRLYQLGFFSNIEVQVTPQAQGIQVIFVVTENQLLGEIKIYGNHNIDSDEILENMRVNQERYLAQHTLSLDVIRIKEFYRKKGFAFVDVQTEVKPAGSWVNLHVRIDEGPEVTVRNINFFGNHSLSKEDLLGLTKTKESGFLSSETYNDDVFQEDLLLMRNFYRSEGFLDVRMHLRDVTYSTDRTMMDIAIVVEEGPCYTIDKITFEGQQLFSQQELEIRTKLRVGSIFKQNEMLDDKNKMERLYGENGFLNIRISPVVSIVDLKRAVVSIHYKIEEGAKTYIRKIDIKGNLLTQEEVIRREFSLTPGEQFNLGKVENGQMRVNRLRYFDSIKMDFLDTDDPSWKDLLISVEEGRTGNIRFAAGVTSDLGVIGEISFTKNNFDIAAWPSSWNEFFSGDSFTGAGQTFDIYLQVAEDLLRFRVGFTEPYLFGYNWGMGIEAYSLMRGYESWTEERFGAQLSIGKRLMEDLELKWTYRIEEISIDDIDQDAPRDVFAVEGNHLLSSLTMSLTLDTRDDFIFATRGYILGMSYEMAGVFLGGDHHFSKINLRAAWFQTVYTTNAGNKHVLSLGMQMGFAAPHSSSEDVPIFERFFAGGATSIRGFDYRSVGPKENFPGRSHDPIGGKFITIGTIEYSIPLYEDILRFVLFSDVGNVVDDVGNDIFDSMRASVGFGVRVKIPMLGPRPIAFDFGFPILKEDDDDTRVFSFSFGKEF